jgi:N-acetylglucosamine-6-phosphate deacetylase
MRVAFRNGRLLTGAGIELERTLLVRDGRIEALVEASDAPTADRDIDLDGYLLAPGFIDVQVNGGGGVLFNDAPSVETIAAIARAHRDFGTTGFLPTLISDDLDGVARAMDAVRDAMHAGVPGVLGVHIEGPFLNAERRGVHDASKLRQLDAAAVKLLSRPHAGVTMVTLAPERTTPGFIRQLTDAGVVVSAGHTNATWAQLQPAFAAGLRGFTHLFNAMSPLGSREPGAVGAALGHEHSWCGLIVDGHHVHPEVMKLALRAKRHDRFMLVSDAMPSVGAQTKNFVLNGRPITVVDNKCLDEDGRLAGADLDMATAVRNAVNMLGLPLPVAAHMASANPAEFLGLADTGRLEAGRRADLVLLDDELRPLETWIAGRSRADMD